MHSQIENEEIAERYVLGRLAPQEREAFEEHFFGCEECFQKVQDVERFRAGVRDAARRGLCNDALEHPLKRDWAVWLRWAFAVTACTTVALGLVIGWIVGGEIPSLRRELRSTAAQLHQEQQARAEIEQKLASAERPEGNIPFVLLEASRAAEKPESVILAGGAKRLVVWIETGPTRYQSFRMQVFAPGDRLVLSLDHLQRGGYGALAASLPADQLPIGDLRITLTGLNPPPASLLGEYRLKVARQ